MLTDREKEINKMVDSIMTQEKWENNKKKHIESLFNKYKTELDKYIWIESLEDYDEIKLGGYVRYVNMNGELKWGGILSKKTVKKSGIHMMALINTTRDIFNVSFEKNYIFYKKHTSPNDKMRDLFISYLDKDNYNI